MDLRCVSASLAAAPKPHPPTDNIHYSLEIAFPISNAHRKLQSTVCAPQTSPLFRNGLRTAADPKTLTRPPNSPKLVEQVPVSLPVGSARPCQTPHGTRTRVLSSVICKKMGKRLLQDLYSTWQGLLILILMGVFFFTHFIECVNVLWRYAQFVTLWHSWVTLLVLP